ncbi:MAG: hypothetical protein HY252_15495 [Sphingobacteriales bacterium]|nr:hypothetical protein [Sphingobacteriales bacterium]
MSELKKKSEENLRAAQLLNLNEHRLFASSVHCAYYSCFQLIKSILLKHVFQSEDEYNLEENKSNKNSHEFAINRLSIDFAKKRPLELRKYSNEINQLKELRVISDYKLEEIQIDKSQKAVDLAIRVRNVLLREYKV